MTLKFFDPNRNHLFIFLLILLIAVITRLASVNYNTFPHGDVLIEAKITDQTNTRSYFELPYFGSNHTITAQISDRIIDTNEPPLWVFLLDVYHSLTGQSGYTSAKHLSFISGIAFIIVLFLLLQRVSSKYIAIAITSSAAFNHFFIDYSGNGSRYMLQAFSITLLLYLLFHPNNSIRKYIYMALVFSLLTLNTYQMIFLILPLSFSILLLNRKNVKKLIIMYIFIALFISPWVIYNFNEYNTPLLATNTQYLGNKLGIPSTSIWANKRFITNFASSLEIFKVFLPQLPIFMIKNGIFLSKKLLVIFPIIPLIILIAIKKLINRSISKKEIITFCFIIFYTTLIFSLNVLKFRYTLVLFALLFILTSQILMTLSSRIRKKIISFILLTTIVLTIAVFVKNPYHTYYYDGVLTEDQFRESGEIKFMDLLTSHEKFSRQIPPDVTIHTDKQRAYFINNPVVVPSIIDFPDDYQEIIEHFKIEYIWSGGVIDPNILNPYKLSLIQHQPNQYLYRINKL